MPKVKTNLGLGPFGPLDRPPLPRSSRPQAPPSQCVTQAVPEATEPAPVATPESASAGSDETQRPFDGDRLL